VQQKTTELAEKANELIALNEDLEGFSYSVSHDLRAPVRAVDGFARMLEEDYGERLDGEGRRLLGVVRESARQMGQLIDDLLAFSRLGREPLRTERVQLDDLVRQTIGELRRECGSRRVDFTVGELGVVEADPALLKQAFVNLLGNAIKFTRKSDPAVVEVGRRVEPGPSAASVYYVKDNGTGFDMHHAEKLFGVFQRLHSAKDYEGTGIGLAIVQRVIDRHGGRVWAEAKPGEDATFYFMLRGGSAEGSVSEAPAA
jgi:light-regulated signal transduction histidine kinase (bacteriophytochrome)